MGVASDVLDSSEKEKKKKNPAEIRKRQDPNNTMLRGDMGCRESRNRSKLIKQCTFVHCLGIMDEHFPV